jgi:hypothetical protein
MAKWPYGQAKILLFLRPRFSRKWGRLSETGHKKKPFVPSFWGRENFN